MTLNKTKIIYEYDELNRLTKVLFEGKLELIYKYDALGNITEIIKKVLK